MASITAIVEKLAFWLNEQSFSPGVRAVTDFGKSASVYPSIRISLIDEELNSISNISRARISVEVFTQAGRRELSLNAAISLAHQIHRALLSCHSLGNMSRKLSIIGITYPDVPDKGNGQVVSCAQLELSISYSLSG